MFYSFWDVLRDDNGSVAIEYGIIPLFTALAIFSAAMAVGTKVRTTLNMVSAGLQPAVVVVDEPPWAP
jgi:Flp pilus assembly pilin Flp